MTQVTPSPPAAAAPKPIRVRFDRFELDEPNASLTCDGKPIALAPTPFAVLCALVRQEGSLVTKNALLDEVWGHRFVTESVLKTVVGKLRTALQDDARQPRFIETVSRRGYRFIGRTIAAVPHSAQRSDTTHAAHDESFIGRAEALANLASAWDRACAGKRAIVWIAGEPGIGKTTLIERFVAPLADHTCIRGQCVEQYGAGEPYLPVLEALGQLCRRDASLVPLLRSVAPTWLLQLPWLLTADERDALRRELAGVGADRMLREMGELLDRYTEHRPLLLVTEDLHWSDRATLQLLDYIARRPRELRLMWLASFRLSEVVALDHPLNPLRRELRLHGMCEEIILDPFSESEVEQYIAHNAPAMATDETFVRALHERTDGVPLFVTHVLRELVHGAREGAGPAPAEQIARMAVPENLAAIIQHYLGKLSDERRQLLTAAAVCGVEFRVHTLADVLGSDAAAVGEQCDQLVRERFWLAAPRLGRVEDGTDAPYSFKHALFHRVVYECASATARAQLHGKAGLALERERAAGVPVVAAELAMHFERAREPSAALRYYAEAAEAALLHFSPREGMVLAERGLNLVERARGGAQRDDWQITLATLQAVSAAHLLGISSDAAKEAYGRAYSLLSAAPRYRLRELLLHGFGLTLCVRADYAEAFTFAEHCATLASATNDPVLLLGACTVKGEVHMLQGRPREGREWVERGLGVIASLDAPGDAAFAPQITLLGLLGMHLLHLGFVEAARRTLNEARDRATDWGQPMAQSIAIWFDALFEVRLGNAPRVAALGAEMEALVEKHGLAQGRAAGRWFRGWAQARLNKPRDGFRLIKEAYEENTRLGMRAGGSEVLGYAVEALLLAGDLDGAQEQLEEALGVARTLGERVYLPQLLTLQATLARARGKRSDATACARRAIQEARDQQAPWLELTPLIELCESKDATRDERQALGALIERMPEAKDTHAVSRARAVLAKR